LFLFLCFLGSKPGSKSVLTG